MVGPFLQYTEPGVYTRTLTEQGLANLSGAERIPLLIGIGSEVLPLVDYEIVRGSSSIADNLMTDEDVSSQLTGLNRNFTTSKYPIVDGSGGGLTTNKATDVTVSINGSPAGVSFVAGETGEVILSSIPRDTDEILITYYYKRTDTLKEGEDLSNQADGSNTEFKVFYPPIVDGNDGGIATTDIEKITVLVNDVEATVTSVDGQSGTFELDTAPAVTDVVLVSYYTNTWQDTFDYLPVSGITEVIRVGTAPGRSDYTETLDFVIEENKIQWGNSFSVAAGTTIPSTSAFQDQINGFLYDNKVYIRPASGTVDGSNDIFTLEYIPTNGTGKGRPTDDISLIKVYVGTKPATALSAGEVEVTKIEALTKKIYLKDAPTAGQYVFVTYWHNQISDDTFTLTCTKASTATEAGEYEVVSENNGDVLYIEEDRPSAAVADPDFASEGVTYPPGGFDGQTVPGYGIEETILLNFINDKEYLVLSSIGPDGSNGSGSLDQTYIDAKTGTRFTVMTGTSVTYQASDLVEFDIMKTYTTQVIPQYNIPGLKITINSLLSVGVSNTATLVSYNKSGLEPDVGSFYYITLNYAKTEYPIKIFTKLKNVTTEIGEVNTDNRLSLAAYLAFQNGANVIALGQVLRDNTEVDALATSYDEVLRQVESPLRESGIKPNIICPITTKQDVINNVRIHCEKMSTIRYKGERTGVFGYAVGTTPEQAQSFARNMKSERLVGIYPDGAIVGLVDELGNVNESILDGSFLASAFTGLAVNPIYDVATPLTNKLLSGFRRLHRLVDVISMNQTAASGLTVLEDLIPNLLVRHAMTTNPQNVLTREPTVIYIKDFVQIQIRNNLNQYIGIKLLPNVMGDIESTVNNLMNILVNRAIITAFSGTATIQDENDPTIVNVECFYSPVFPLNWLVSQFSLRVSL